MAGKRIEWLDIAKGLGILSVVAGHCIPLTNPLCQLIFQFHMPLFFMLSGFTFSEKDSFLTTLKKKAKSLIVPFLGYFLLGLAVTLAVTPWRKALTLEGIKADLILADPSNIHNSSIWFLVCLFFVAVIFWVLKKFPVVLQILAVIFAFAVAVWYAKVRTFHPIFGYARLPLNLDCVPTGLVFYMLGHYARRLKLTEKSTSSIWIEAVIALVATAVTLVVFKFNGYVNTHGLVYNNPLLFVLGGLSGSLAVFGFSALISRISAGVPFYGKNILVWYGQNSLVVLGFQSLLIRLYALYIATYRGEFLSLYAFPYTHAFISTVLVAFLLCPICVWLQHKVTDIFHKKGQSYEKNSGA